MNASILIFGRDTLLIAIPFVLFLVISIFRLDRRFALPNDSQNRRPPAASMDKFENQNLREFEARLSGRRSNC